MRIPLLENWVHFHYFSKCFCLVNQGKEIVHKRPQCSLFFLGEETMWCTDSERRSQMSCTQGTDSDRSIDEGRLVCTVHRRLHVGCKPWVFQAPHTLVPPARLPSLSVALTCSLWSQRLFGRSNWTVKFTPFKSAAGDEGGISLAYG